MCVEDNDYARDAILVHTPVTETFIELILETHRDFTWLTIDETVEVAFCEEYFPFTCSSFGLGKKALHMKRFVFESKFS